MIEIRALGPPEVHVDGTRLAGRSLHRKNLAVLAYLARSPHWTRSRNQLVGLLWSESADQAARHSLRQAIRDLKSALGDDAFVTSTNDLGMAEDRFELDFERFESLRSDEQWEAAASLVRGEFMEGFSVRGASPFEDWLSAERATWQRRCVDVLLRAADERLAAGNISAGADHAAAALVLDPYSDAAVQTTMRCDALQANPSGAHHHFQRFCERLAAMDLEPNPHTRELAEAIARDRQQPPPALRLASPSQSQGATRRAPLIGRADAFGTASRLWKDTQSLRRGHVLMVEAEPGMGKTRLVEDLVAGARLDGAFVAWVRAVEADETTPWSGLAGLVTGGLLDMPGLVGAAPTDLAALATVVPEIRDQVAPGEKDQLPPIELAVARALQSVCEEQPVVLVFDDAHYLDEQSLKVIHSLARDLARLPSLITLTTSPHHPRAPLEDLRARLTRDIQGQTVRLGAFGEEHLRILAEHMLPKYDDDALQRLTRRLGIDSGGIPLLAVELLQAVALGLDWDQAATSWPQPGRTLDQTPPGDLPQPVVGAIRAGYWRAPAAARRVLQMIAAIDGRVSIEQLARSAELDRNDLQEALDWLEWERWLVSERRGYTFAARIVREVVVRDMLTPGQLERFRELLSDE